MSELRWRRHPRSLHRDVPDGVVIIGLDGGDPVTLTAPGDHVWRLLDSEPTLDEVVDELARHFDASPDEMRADCVAALDELLRLGLVERIGADRDR